MFTNSIDTVSITSHDTIGNWPTTASIITSMNALTTISTATGFPGVSTIDSGISYATVFPAEWTNCFPDFDRVDRMCKIYPGLRIAYDKFVTTYKLVQDDYDNPTAQK